MLVLAALVGGCASHAAPPAAPTPVRRRSAPAATAAALDDLLRGDMAADQAFPWSAKRPLAWSDFRGSPPVEGSEAAKTSYTLYSVWRCKGDVFAFRVIAGFRPRQSWVKPIVLNDSTQRRTILLHEQTHFDLAEVHARRMRRAFEDLAHPCARTDIEIQGLLRRLTEDEKSEQRRYDDETDHGLIADQQAGWSRNVARRLDGP